jgi:hypothetical protein
MHAAWPCRWQMNSRTRFTCTTPSVQTHVSPACTSRWTEFLPTEDGSFRSENQSGPPLPAGPIAATDVGPHDAQHRQPVGPAIPPHRLLAQDLRTSATVQRDSQIATGAGPLELPSLSGGTSRVLPCGQPLGLLALQPLPSGLHVTQAWALLLHMG